MYNLSLYHSDNCIIHVCTNDKVASHLNETLFRWWFKNLSSRISEHFLCGWGISATCCSSSFYASKYDRHDDC